MEQRIRLLGGLEIEEDGKPAAVLKSPQGCALLTYLLVTRKAHRREVLADLLWDATSTASSLRHLRQTLYRLRPVMPQLQISRHEVAYRPDARVWVDLYSLQEALASHEIATIEAGLRIYRDELLAGFHLEGATNFHEWLLLERERLRLKVWNGYRLVCASYMGQDAWNKGIEAARRWLALDEYDEEPVRQLMRFLVAGGQVDAAKGEFEKCRRLLEEEFGVEPDPTTVDLYEQILATSVPALVVNHHHDWGQAPNVRSFFGRQPESEQVAAWLTSATIRLISVVGIGGQGKTTLAAQVARSNANHFDTIYWRSLINAPPFEVLLADYLGFLNRRQFVLPEGTSAQLAAVQRHLQHSRSLLVLDNLETVLDPNRTGHFRSDYEPYELLLRLFAEGGHHGTLLLTSRETLLMVERLQQQFNRVVTLHLDGLEAPATACILAAEEIQAPLETVAELTSHYSGNPLALQLVAQTIAEFYFGNVDTFLAAQVLIFDDIRALLDQQFKRLSALEQEIMRWLAVTREATNPLSLADDIIQPVSRQELLNAMKRLRRRSLLVRERAGYTLQNVVMEYLTERLIDAAVSELTSGSLDSLHRHPLMQARTMEYVRESQTRLLLHPVAALIKRRLTSEQIMVGFQQLLDGLRQSEFRAITYAGGTILNLLLDLRVNLAGLSFSGLTLRQADLRGHKVMHVDLSMTRLIDCRFTQPFGRIESVALSPDGQLVAGAGDDGVVRVYRLQDGQLTKALAGHTSTVKHLSFSADGTRLASVFQDGSASIWDVATWRLVAELDEARLYHCASLSRQDHLLACAGSSAGVTLWAFDRGEVIQTDAVHVAYVTAVAFDPTGRLLASADYSGSLHLWQVTAESSVIARSVGAVKFRSHGDTPGQGETAIKALCFSTSGTWLAIGMATGEIIVWDVECEVEVATLTGHSRSVFALAFSDDSEMLFSGSGDHTLRIWALHDRRMVNLLQLDETIWSMHYSSADRRLVTGNEGGAIREWSIPTPNEIYLRQTFHGYRHSLLHVRWSPNGHRLATVNIQGDVRLWEVIDGNLQNHALLDGYRLYAGQIGLDFSPDARWLAVASEQCTEIWDVHTMQKASVLPGLMRQQSVTYLTQTSLLVTGGASPLDAGDQATTVTIWDVSNPWSPTLSHRLPPVRTTERVAVSPTRQTLAILDAGIPSFVSLCHAETGEHLGRLLTSTDYEYASLVVFDPAGEHLAVEGPDFSIGLWNIADLHTPTFVRSMVGHRDRVISAHFHPQRSLLVTGGIDGSIRLWNVETGKEVSVLGTHPQFVTDVAFSPHGDVVVSVGKEGLTCFWDVETGECLKTIEPLGPYDGLNITGATGISDSQREALMALGAFDSHRAELGSHTHRL